MTLVWEGRINGVLAMGLSMLIASFTMLGFAGNLIVNFGDEFNLLDIRNPILVTLALGEIALVYSIVGIGSVCCKSAWTLYVYAGVSVLAGVAAIGTGSAIISQGGVFKNVEELANLNDEAVSLTKIFSLETFATCCQSSDNLLCSEIQEPCVRLEEDFLFLP